MPQIPLAFAAELGHEHGSLLELLSRLEAATQPGTEGGTGPLPALLREVQANLRRHFDFEEQDGYMSQALTDAPHLYNAAQELLAEHGRMAADLNALITFAAAAEGAVTPTLQVQVRQWVLLVRRHEARENSLIQKACNQDIGADD